jgi:predicted nucleic acid-binding Zn ribbon protein
MVTPVRDILAASVKAWGLEPAARLVAVRRAWARVAGGALAAASAPLGIRDGRLRVAVLHVAAAQEVRLRSAVIARALNQELGEPVIHEVVTVPRRTLPSIGTPQAPRAARKRPAR